MHLAFDAESNLNSEPLSLSFPRLSSQTEILTNLTEIAFDNIVRKGEKC